MESPKEAKDRKGGGDTGWWAAFVALFATSAAADPKADGGGEAMSVNSSGDAGADGGDGDGGGGGD
jgi:hypothetical protein